MCYATARVAPASASVGKPQLPAIDLRHCVSCCGSACPPLCRQVDYFTTFLKLKPQGTINQSHVRFLSPERNVGINSGVYTFDVEKDGKHEKVSWWGAATLAGSWRPLAYA
jgi:hypothetical protein